MMSKTYIYQCDPWVKTKLYSFCWADILNQHKCMHDIALQLSGV